MLRRVRDGADGLVESCAGKSTMATGDLPTGRVVSLADPLRQFAPAAPHCLVRSGRAACLLPPLAGEGWDGGAFSPTTTTHYPNHVHWRG